MRWHTLILGKFFRLVGRVRRRDTLRDIRRRQRRWRRLTQPLAFATHKERYVVQTSDHAIGKALFVHGEFDFTKFTTVLKLLDRDGHGLVVDIGANVGSICIPAVRRGLADRAVAIEPEPTSFTLLRINVQWNGLAARIACHSFAAGSSAGEAWLDYPSPRNAGDVRVRTAEGSGVQVQIRPIDELGLALNPADDLIWMDIQGYEMEALRGMSEALRLQVPLVMEFWPDKLGRTGSVEDLLGLLRTYETFVDLSSEGLTRRPIGDLVDVWSGLASTAEAATDILVV